jgi:hypothetical protein
MKTDVTPSAGSPARRFAVAAVLACALAATPAFAQNDGGTTPVTNREVGAKDVAQTPLKDLNLRKDPIPEVLLRAVDAPYSVDGLSKCSHYVAAVEELDAVLGIDFDVASPEDRRISAGRVAQSIVGSFIPFRGVVREVSGAAKHERDFQEAILHGMMRRAFLKGMGLKLGCEYPARPADDATRARVQEEIAEAERLAAAEAQRKKDEEERQEQEEKERRRREKDND